MRKPAFGICVLIKAHINCTVAAQLVSAFLTRLIYGTGPFLPRSAIKSESYLNMTDKHVAEFSKTAC